MEKLWTSPFKLNDECKPTTSEEIPRKDISSDKNPGAPIKDYGDTTYKNSGISFDDAEHHTCGNLPNLFENLQHDKLTATSQKPNIEDYQGNKMSRFQYLCNSKKKEEKENGIPRIIISIF